MDTEETNSAHAVKRKAALIRQLWWALLGVVVAVNVAYWTWNLWPQQTFGKCLVKMAEKAQGSTYIFNSLLRTNCHHLPREGASVPLGE
jgi:hypothetical protein